MQDRQRPTLDIVTVLAILFLAAGCRSLNHLIDGGSTEKTGSSAPVTPPSGDPAVRSLAVQALASPGCGGPARPGDTCPDIPVGLTTFVVHNRDIGGSAVSVTSDANGLFSLSVAPGTYSIHKDVGFGYPSCPDASIVVPEDKDASLVLHCDSGMR